MAKQKVLKAQLYVAGKHNVRGWLASEKYDGMRAIWIPEARGVCHPFCAKPDVVCTGLFSSYGNVIHAPQLWLDALPLDLCLDGELYMGKQMLQPTLSIARSHTPDNRWSQLTYKVFDIPFGMSDYKDARLDGIENKVVSRVCYERVPYAQADEWVESKVQDIIKEGGEGIMLRPNVLYWEPRRTASILKVKLTDVDEGIVVDIEPGKGKYTGMVGSLKVEWKGLRFNVSGLTDEERGRTDWMGRRVRFKYATTMTDSGVPREGRLCRS